MSDLLLPMLLISAGLGLLFVPLTLMVVSHVRDEETGAASGLMNTGQQIGGAIGLAAIGTIAWTSVAHSVRDQMTAAAVGGGAPTAAGGGATSSAVPGVPTAVLDQALTVGFSTGLLIAAGVVLASFVVALVTTWTPGRWRLSSAVLDDRQQPCDEVLGTCLVPNAN